MKLGNAPVSFGVYRAGEPTNPPWSTVLDAIAAAGYPGTELGPYGYLPTRADELAAALRARNLILGSSFVGLPLGRAEAREASVRTVVEVAELLAAEGVAEVILADEGSPAREAVAGRVGAGDGWSDAEWRACAGTMEACARAIERLKMRVVVHHHAGTFIETAAEIDRLMAETDAERVGLLLDTGHAVYGGADPLDVLARHGARVRYVHLKDVDRDVYALGLPMQEAWRRGVFCPLGRGVVPFPTLIERLRARAYGGWLIVEQDVVASADGRLDPDPFESAKASRAYLREACGV